MQVKFIENCRATHDNFTFEKNAKNKWTKYNLRNYFYKNQMKAGGVY